MFANSLSKAKLLKLGQGPFQTPKLVNVLIGVSAQVSVELPLAPIVVPVATA